MKTVTILRDLFTKQRKPVLICKAGTKAVQTGTLMNGSMITVKVEGYATELCLSAKDVK